VDSVGVGWKVWESALIMARWVVTNNSLFTGRRVLEVGAGVGLLGIVAAPYCDEIVLTDCVEKVRI
jgi:predicted nicotinamide N-methyase